MGTTMPGMKRVYRSSVVTLGPDATVESAELAIQQEARGLGHRPVDGTAHAQELMPPVTEAQVRRKGERIGMTPEEFRSRQGSIAFRWNHTLHENVVVGTRWEGWVEVEPDHNSGDAQV